MLEGLRGFAILIGVLFRAGRPPPGGFVGMDVFFVVSGFVVTNMIQRERTSPRRSGIGRFYLRRFKRLTPALAVMVGVTMILALFLLSPFGLQQPAAETGLGDGRSTRNFLAPSRAVMSISPSPLRPRDVTHVKAIVFDPHVPRKFRFGEVAEPVPAAPSEMLIEVKAISLNFGEVFSTDNAEHPGDIPGWDSSGVVVVPAADGSGPPAGTRVVGAGWSQAWRNGASSRPTTSQWCPKHWTFRLRRRFRSQA